jgi:hypothetical protein
VSGVLEVVPDLGEIRIRQQLTERSKARIVGGAE